MRRKLTCGRCPESDFGWCVIWAELRPGDAPACDYGKKIMRKAYMARYMRRFRQQAYDNKKRGTGS